MIGLIKHLIREYKETKRIEKITAKSGKLWKEMSKGRMSKKRAAEMSREWSRLAFQAQDKYEQQQQELDELNKVK